MIFDTTPDISVLIAPHLGLARRLARSYARRTGNPRLVEKLESAALLGLTQAARSFVPARGNVFWGYARSRVYGAMRDELRAWAPAGYRRAGQMACHGPAPELVQPGEETFLAETLLDEESGPVGWELEYHDEVAGLARRLAGGAGAEAFLLHYTRADCADPPGVAARVGIGVARVFQVQRQARARLARRFSDPADLILFGPRYGMAGAVVLEGKG